MAIGKVIKGDGTPETTPDPARPLLRPPRPGVLNAEVYDAHQSAQAIIESARKQAQEIVEAAQRERERIFAEAREAARQEGLAAVSESFLRANRERSAILENAEKDIVALSLRVAEKILGRDLERDPTLVVDLCAHAIENVRASHQIVVRIHPKDAAILRENRLRLMEQIGRVKEISLKEDADVPRAGCIVETETGVIDAQLSTQLEMLRTVLLGEEEKKEGPV